MSGKKFSLIAVGVIVAGAAYSGLAMSVEDIESGALELTTAPNGQMAVAQPVSDAFVVLASVNADAISDQGEADEVPENYLLLTPLEVFFPEEVAA